MQTCDDVLITRLKKSGRYEKALPKESTEGLVFQTLGYYDHVSIEAVSTSGMLASKCSVGNDVYTESVVLIPATNQEMIINEQFMIGVLSFILSDEIHVDSPEILCREIEELFKDHKDLTVKSYLTTGASSLAILATCNNHSRIAADLEKYFQEIQSYCVHRGTCHYCFSIPLMRLNLIEESSSFPEDELLIAERIKTREELKTEDNILHGVTISFARRMKEQGKSQIESFESWIKSLKGELLAETGCSIPVSASISGTDDYLLLIKHVSLGTLLKLFVSGGPLEKDVDNDYYDSTCTTLLFKGQEKDSLNYNRNFTTTKESRKKQNTGWSNDHEWEEIVKLFRELIQKSDISECNHYLSDFLELKNSRYTEWVYRTYQPFMAQCFMLLIHELIMENDPGCTLRDARIFFDNLYNMLESLLNTSVYFTDSPGFRKIENNIVPRLILSYQNIINQYASMWDQTASRDRKTLRTRNHRFLFAPHMGNEVYATMLFGDLPPDFRLIVLSLPISDALRPSMSLALSFHEVGHYIGVRDRQSKKNQVKGRERFFADVATRFFSCSIIEEYINYYTGNNSPIDIESLVTGSSGNDKIASFLSTLLFVLMEYQKSFSEQVWISYQNVKKLQLERYSQSIDKCEGDRNREIIRRRKAALEEGYFSEITSLMKAVIHHQIIGCHDDIIDEFRVCCEDQISEQWGNEANKISQLSRYQNFEETITPILDSIAQSLIVDSEVDIVSKTETILSEIAADVFMVRSLNMDIDDYLFLFFDMIQTRSPKSQVKSQAQNFNMSGNNKIRMLSLCKAIIERDRNHQEDKCLLEERIRMMLTMDPRTEEVNDQKVHEYYDKYRKFKSEIVNALYKYQREYDNATQWKRDIQRNVSPFYEISDYTKQIFEDKRYNQKNEFAKKIKDLYTFTKDEERRVHSLTKLMKKYYEFGFWQ